MKSQLSWLTGALLSVALTQVASAAAFNVKIEGRITKPQGACADGASLCGTARLEGYGDAEYRAYRYGSGEPSGACGALPGFSDFGALVTFSLADGSTLWLYELGTQCAAGNSLPTGGPKSYGNPIFFTARWQVLFGIGQFSGLIGGGTNSGTFAGAAIVARYGGTLDPGHGVGQARLAWNLQLNGAPTTCAYVGAAAVRVNVIGTTSTQLEFGCDEGAAEFPAEAGVDTFHVALVDAAGQTLGETAFASQIFAGFTTDIGTVVFSFVE